MCTDSKLVKLPQDTDGDGLPDAWEMKQRLYDPNLSAVKPYEIGSATTVTGINDGESDLDIGYIPPGSTTANGERVVDTSADPGTPTKIHDEYGDGFTAFEEYRGAFVFGAFFRFDDLPNQGGPSNPPGFGGPLVKDVFIHEGTGYMQLTDVAPVSKSTMMAMHGISYHTIKADEMSDEFAADGSAEAGFMDPYFDITAGGHQRAIWIKKEQLPKQAKKGQVIFGFTNGKGVNSHPAPILLYDKAIKDEGENVDVDSGTPTSVREFGRYTVSHEVLHKLQLSHTQQAIAPGALPANTYNNGVYDLEGSTDGPRTWSLVQVTRNPSNPNKFASAALERLCSAAEVEMSLPSTVDEEPPAVTVLLHGVEHRAARQKWQAPAAVTGNLIYWIHSGTVIDAYPEFGTLRAALRVAEIQKLKIKS